MRFNKSEIVTKIHLVISVVIVVPASVIYGFYPGLVLNLQVNSLDIANLLKAIMGLYLAFSIVWTLGLFKNNFLKIALWSNMLFMLGLGLGRLVSALFDGIPSLTFSLGTIGELFLGIYGLWVLLFLNSKPNFY